MNASEYLLDSLVRAKEHADKAGDIISRLLEEQKKSESQLTAREVKNQDGRTK